jgi:hypothetical protein
VNKKKILSRGAKEWYHLLVLLYRPLDAFMLSRKLQFSRLITGGLVRLVPFCMVVAEMTRSV